MKIVVDAFGGDRAPSETVKGCVAAVKEKSGFSIVLAGKKSAIEAELQACGYSGNRLEILDCADVITNEEQPTSAIRQKPDSSLVKGLDYLKHEADAEAFVSAGSTGAVLAGSLLRVGRIKGISRPALAPVIPTVKGGYVTIVDSGANVDCKPINLLHFAFMGSAYMRSYFGMDNPRVALLSNGTEDKKGNQLSHEAFELLKAAKGINFVGNMEARELMSGDYDVIVADGFDGNIALKSVEGAVKAVMTMLKAEVMTSFTAKIGALFMRKTFKNLKRKTDYNSVGGAVFLGIDKVVVKAHGASGEAAFKSAILQAVSLVENKLTDKIKADLAQADVQNAAE